MVYSDWMFFGLARLKFIPMRSLSLLSTTQTPKKHLVPIEVIRFRDSLGHIPVPVTDTATLCPIQQSGLQHWHYAHLTPYIRWRKAAVVMQSYQTPTSVFNPRLLQRVLMRPRACSSCLCATWFSERDWFPAGTFTPTGLLRDSPKTTWSLTSQPCTQEPQTGDWNVQYLHLTTLYFNRLKRSR